MVSCEFNQKMLNAGLVSGLDEQDNENICVHSASWAYVNTVCEYISNIYIHCEYINNIYILRMYKQCTGAFETAYSEHVYTKLYIGMMFTRNCL